MFPFKIGSSIYDLGTFELPARQKLLEAKGALQKHNKELSYLCDKIDDLVALSATLARCVLQYTEKHRSASKIGVEEDESQEYEKFEDEIDIDTFRLIKHVILQYPQRTESMSQQKNSQQLHLHTKIDNLVVLSFLDTLLRFSWSPFWQWDISRCQKAILVVLTTY